MNLSKKRRYTLAVLSLLEGQLDDMKLEIQSRISNKKRDLERKKELLIAVEDTENSLTNLRELYNKTELTREEYNRIAQAMTIMDLVLSGAVQKKTLINVFDETSKIYPDAKNLIDRNNIMNTFN